MKLSRINQVTCLIYCVLIQATEVIGKLHSVKVIRTNISKQVSSSWQSANNGHHTQITEN